MKFSNTLPPIPFDPKLLTNPFDSMRFVRYRTTSLETSHQHTLHAEPDLGIPIDLIDPSTYKATPGPAPLLFLHLRVVCRVVSCVVC
jgi:RNA polymerase II-associated factor 1